MKIVRGFFQTLVALLLISAFFVGASWFTGRPLPLLVYCYLSQTCGP
jgi:hypothetical protein